MALVHYEYCSTLNSFDNYKNKAENEDKIYGKPPEYIALKGNVKDRVNGNTKILNDFSNSKNKAGNDKDNNYGKLPEYFALKGNEKDSLNGNTNTYINQIGTTVINDNKPNNLKRYKCDSWDYAVRQKGILTEHIEALRGKDKELFYNKCKFNSMKSVT